MGRSRQGTMTGFSLDWRNRTLYYCFILLFVVSISVAVLSFLSSQQQGPTARYISFSKQVESLLDHISSGSWVTVRDLRDECNSITDEVIRFSNESCRAEAAIRMRSNLVEGLVSMLYFKDFWTEETGVALELNMARNLTAYFKPCSSYEEDESEGHPWVENQLAPIMSVEPDLRQLRVLLYNLRNSELKTMFGEVSSTCSVEFPRSPTSKVLLYKVSGCIIYWSDQLEAWNQREYGIGIKEILPLLRCKQLAMQWIDIEQPLEDLIVT